MQTIFLALMLFGYIGTFIALLLFTSNDGPLNRYAYESWALGTTALAVLSVTILNHHPDLAANDPIQRMAWAEMAVAVFFIFVWYTHTPRPWDQIR